jgi:hypothetical protein
VLEGIRGIAGDFERFRLGTRDMLDGESRSYLVPALHLLFSRFTVLFQTRVVPSSNNFRVDWISVPLTADSLDWSALREVWCQ